VAWREKTGNEILRSCRCSLAVLCVIADNKELSSFVQESSALDAKILRKSSGHEVTSFLFPAQLVCFNNAAAAATCM
jgi:hypothetical protein